MTMLLFHILTFEFSLSIGDVTCGYDLLYPSIGALAASTYFWCGSADAVGTFFYAQSPAQAGTCLLSLRPLLQ